MSDENGAQADQILRFAGQVGRPGTPAAQKAVARGWLTADGGVTTEGAELIEALEDQQGNRSVFRSVP